MQLKVSEATRRLKDQKMISIEKSKITSMLNDDGNNAKQ